MYCVKCGKQLSDNVRFCVYCGTPTMLQEDSAPRSSHPQDSSKEHRSTSANVSNGPRGITPKALIAVVVVLLLSIL